MSHTFTLLLLTACALLAKAATLKPIVLVNGLSGSVIEYRKLSDDSKWEVIWLDLFRDTVLRKDSLHKMTFRYNATDDSYRNMTGLEVKTGDFGSTKSVDYLVKVMSVGFGPAAYMIDMIKYMEGKGYKRDNNLKAGNYDWRYPYHKMDQWKSNMDTLIEQLYNSNNGTRVVIVGHCQGGIVATRYLAEKPQEWKDRFVDSYHVVGVPFLGTQMAMQAILSGTSEDFKILGFNLLPLLPMRAAVRTFGAMAGLLPHTGFDDGAIVVTGKRNYSSSDMEQLLIDCGAHDTLAQMKRSIERNTPIPHPGVRVECHVGVGHPTHQILGYADNNFDKQPKHLSEVDGDGTVTTRSASWCKNFAAMRPDLRFDYHEWQGIEHTALIQSNAVAQTIFNSVNK